ncbi:MAG: hypothetical protein HYX34_12040 [Actinobacteria bacterium]|nr:hypothetical protein [Actinomycetota bacterium]
MRFERLVVEVPGGTLALPLHPQLTVVCGLERAVREALVGELIGSLGPSRPGVHVEVLEASGRRLAVFRPAGGSPRVVEVGTARDLTDEFTDPDGRVDLLAAHGIDVRLARRVLRFTAHELRTAARGDTAVRELAGLDQTALWSAAARVRTTEEQLNAAAEAVGAAPEDAELIDRIEASHAEYELAQEKLSAIRQLAFAVGGVAAISAAMVGLVEPLLAVPLVAIALAATAVALRFRMRAHRAARTEQQSLAAAGADSYLVFQLRRVDGLVSNSLHRKRLLAVAAEHRAAAQAWTELAGDASVSWALEHHDQIVAAAGVQRDARGVEAMSSSGASVDDDTAGAVAHALTARFAEVRELGRDGEGLPLVLDEPFSAVDPTLKPSLLEMLVRTATTTQAVLLTGDEDVAMWARLEAMNGNLSVLEPTSSGAATAGDRAADPASRS